MTATTKTKTNLLDVTPTVGKSSIVTNQDTGEITLSNPFGGLAINNGGLILPSPNYSIRANCQVGGWRKSDGETPINGTGKKLDFGIVHCQPMYGDLGLTKAENWIQIWGVSDQVVPNVVWVTYLKTQSLTLAANTMLELGIEGKRPEDVIFHSMFASKSSSGGSPYFIVTFETSEREANDPLREKIQDFLLW